MAVSGVGATPQLNAGNPDQVANKQNDSYIPSNGLPVVLGPSRGNSGNETRRSSGQGYLGKATPEWANKALASLNENSGRGSFAEGNRRASVEYIGGKPFLAVQNGPIAGKNVDESRQYIPLAQMGNGTFRLESSMERGPGIRIVQ
jgi:hypothetical protein